MHKHLWVTGTVGLAAIGLLFRDEFFGRIYFDRLCSREAGVVVHNRIDLPPEYYIEDAGTRAAAKPSGYPQQVPGAPAWQHLQQLPREVVLQHPRIEKSVAAATGWQGTKLYTWTNFHYWGGWLINATTWNHVTANGCPADSSFTSQAMHSINLKKEKP